MMGHLEDLDRGRMNGGRGEPPGTPVCTADVWMIVLLGAINHWKRSLCESFAMGPADSSPAQRRTTPSA